MAKQLTDATRARARERIPVDAATRATTCATRRDVDVSLTALRTTRRGKSDATRIAAAAALGGGVACLR